MEISATEVTVSDIASVTVSLVEESAVDEDVDVSDAVDSG